MVFIQLCSWFQSTAYLNNTHLQLMDVNHPNLGCEARRQNDCFPHFLQYFSNITVTCHCWIIKTIMFFLSLKLLSLITADDYYSKIWLVGTPVHYVYYFLLTFWPVALDLQSKCQHPVGSCISPDTTKTYSIGQKLSKK